MGTRMKWYRLRWRVVLMLAAVVLLSCGYAAWRIYNVVRVRAMGDGPAGPTIAAASFEKKWHEGPVVFIGVGDSITRGLGANKEHTYYELLLRNDDAVYPDMAGRELMRVFELTESRNYAQDYSTSQDHITNQLARIPTYGREVRGIVVLTSGGNDLIHDYGRTPPQDGAMYGCTYVQATVWCENLKGRLETLLNGLMEKFPGGCDIFFATVYDPTDGAGDPETMWLPRWRDCVKVLGLANSKIAELCEQYPNVHLVDIHTAFLGHGIHCDEFWRKHYRSDDPHFWYYYNLEDPNRRGFDAIRRLYLQEMVKVFAGEQ